MQTATTATDIEFTEAEGGVTRVALVGRLDSPGVDRVDLKLTAHTVPRGARTIIDLSRVEFVGSLAIRMFITLARALARKNGALVLYAPQPLVKQVFDTVSLGEIVPLRADAGSALEAVRG
jgi:anti-anti-sigma factor